MTSQFDLSRFYDVIIHNSIFHLGLLTREFQIPNENNLIRFLWANGKEEQMNFVSELFIQASCSRLRSLKVRAKAMLKVSLGKRANGLAKKDVFSNINLDFVKPRVSHLRWGEYTRL